jgi:hypothetical protein
MFLLIVMLGEMLPTLALATVFYSKDEALQMAFGGDATIEVMSLFPTQSQLEQIEQQAKTKLDSKLFSFYVGKKQGVIVGYAAIDSHQVRTQSETLLIVLDAAGNLRNVHTLAFHEPPEYQAPKRWFEQLANHLVEQLSFDKDIQAVAGATLSTRAALTNSRKVLSVFHVMVKPVNS